MSSIPSIHDAQLDDNAVPLAKYSQIVGMSECAFFGIKNNEADLGVCDQLWSAENRREVQRALTQAQSDIEDVINYFLTPRWVVNEVHLAEADKSIVITKWMKVICFGVETRSLISSGLESIDSSFNADIEDPMVFGPIATTVTDEAEVKVYHSGTHILIYPSSVSISSGQLTIKIPRCRMVLPDYQDEDDIDYSDDDAFGTSIDVERVYNDPSNHGYFSWLYNDLAGFSRKTKTIFADVSEGEVGSSSVYPADFKNGKYFLDRGFDVENVEKIVLNYRSGLLTVPSTLEDAIVRLAHSRMPEEPCACDSVRRVWKRDRNTPEILTRERLNCPFGYSDGAFTAWSMIRRHKLYRMGVL